MMKTIMHNSRPIWSFSFTMTDCEEFMSIYDTILLDIFLAVSQDNFYGHHNGTVDIGLSWKSAAWSHIHKSSCLSSV